MLCNGCVSSKMPSQNNKKLKREIIDDTYHYIRSSVTKKKTLKKWRTRGGENPNDSRPQNFNSNFLVRTFLTNDDAQRNGMRVTLKCTQCEQMKRIAAAASRCLLYSQDFSVHFFVFARFALFRLSAIKRISNLHADDAELSNSIDSRSEDETKKKQVPWKNKFAIN